jgi:hypothetical protein
MILGIHDNHGYKGINGAQRLCHSLIYAQVLVYRLCPNGGFGRYFWFLLEQTYTLLTRLYLRTFHSMLMELRRDTESVVIRSV